MHQTFYIDIDEEITSIVDRLRKAKAKEVVLVVPKRALLIQSIINLKLLKKESEHLKKNVVIVTQDKVGKMLVEKTGITAEQKLDDVDGGEMDLAEGGGRGDSPVEEVLLASGLAEERRNRLENLGSEEYFDGGMEIKKPLAGDAAFSQKMNSSGGQRKEEERIVNRELVVDIGENIKSKKRMDVLRPSEAKNIDANLEDVEYKFSQKNPNEEVSVPEGKVKTKIGIIAGRKKNAAEGRKEDEASRFFNVEPVKKKEKADEYRGIAISGNIKKKLLAFGLVSFLVAAFLAVYLLIPRADVKMILKTETKAMDVEIKASGEVASPKAEGQMIPSKVVAADDEITRSFDSTGKTSANNKKAKGIITIYNEYSEAAQPLVATTRFASEGGKIFRLVKSVSVPGISKVGSEIKPGVIEAEVIADEQGGEYNIEPSRFSIPGFQNSGTEKYAKFYGKSTKAMSGGGEGGETMKSVSAGDIAGAKNKIMEELNRLLKDKLAESAGEGFMILDDAINIGDSVYTISSSEGQVADKFSMTVKAKASAIAFREADAKQIASGLIAGKFGSDSEKEISSDSIVLQFGKSDVDFSKGAVLIRANASGKVVPKIDVSAIKKEILGKSEEELKEYLDNFTGIESIEVSYWPDFLAGKIPLYESRVGLTLDSSADSDVK